MKLYSYSDLASYMRCPKKYEYRNLQDLVKIGISVPQDKGTWVHKLIAADLAGNDWRDMHWNLTRVFTTDIVPFTLDEEILNIPYEAERMFLAYKTKYPEDFAAWKILHVEESMSFELGSDIWIGFTPDLVAEDELGNVWAWDHKTLVTLPQPGEMLVDQQNLVYSIGLRRLYGKRFKGFVFNNIRSKSPSVPKLRKDGLIADVRRIDTTYDVLLRFSADNGIKPYPELTDKLAYLSSHDTFFRRDYFIVPDEALVNAEEDLIHWTAKAEADNALWTRGATNAFGRVTMHRSAGVQACQRCPYFDICQTDFLGMPRHAVLLDYQARTPLDREYVPIREDE